MRVLLDECLPRRLKHELAGHEVYTVPEMGWAGIENGDLLRLAAPQFDVFLTVDKSLHHQQNIGAVSIGVVTLRARRNDLQALLPLMPTVRNVLLEVAPGSVVSVGD